MSFYFVILQTNYGDFLSFIITTGLIQGANQLGRIFIYQDLVRDFKDISKFRVLSIWEVLLLSACLCSIDTVAS